MEHDADVLLTRCLRLYVPGMRGVISKKLKVAFGADEWWTKGVLATFDLERRQRLEGEVSRHEDRDLAESLDVAHFPRIILNHLDTAFSNPFLNRTDAMAEMWEVVDVRNQWAHHHSISLPRALRAAGCMKKVLGDLKCPEALGVQETIKEYAIAPMAIAEEQVMYVSEPPIDTDELDLGELRERVSTPARLWRELRGFLVVEPHVEMPEDANSGEASITIRVLNTAPKGSIEPQIRFRNVSVSTDGVNVRARNRHASRDLDPGEEYTAEYTFPAVQIINLSVQISGEVDTERFFQFETSAELPKEVFAGIRQEFNDRLGALELEAFVERVKAVGTGIDAETSLRELESRRESLRNLVAEIQEKQDALNGLYGHFKLIGGSPLADRVKELASNLIEFRARVEDLEGAIGATKLEQIEVAVAGIREVQLSILRVEAAVRG